MRPSIVAGLVIAELRARLGSSHLYLITPARPKAGELDEFLPAVLEGGVDMVQLRENEMEAGHLMPFCEVARRRTEEFGAIFIVNDRVDVALAADADGVHLGQDDLGIEHARHQMGNRLLIGLSTHSSEQIEAAARTSADYIAVGPIYETPTKPGRPPTGLEIVSRADEIVETPFFAIGGIDLETLPAVTRAGVRRVCVLRGLTDAGDPGAVARRLKGMLTRE